MDQAKCCVSGQDLDGDGIKDVVVDVGELRLVVVPYHRVSRERFANGRISESVRDRIAAAIQGVLTPGGKKGGRA